LRPPASAKHGDEQQREQAVISSLGIAFISSHMIADRTGWLRLVALDVDGLRPRNSAMVRVIP
jgi:hypothetical protein